MGEYDVERALGVLVVIPSQFRSVLSRWKIRERHQVLVARRNPFSIQVSSLGR